MLLVVALLINIDSRKGLEFLVLNVSNLTTRFRSESFGSRNLPVSRRQTNDIKGEKSSS